MAFKFTAEPQEFLTAYRNGVDFDQNESEVSYRLRGNVGDLVQVRQYITVECAVNESRSIPMTYDATVGTLVAPIDFRAEGLSLGATIEVFQGRSFGESTIDRITGRGFNTVYLSTTNLAFLTSGDHSDIYIRCKDAPSYMRYQYGCIPDDTRTESENTFASPVDGNTQAYYVYDLITPSFELLDLKRFGPFKAWDLTTGLQAAYVGTTDDYYHEYQIIHTFKICPYVDTERDNILKEIPPAYLSKTKTLKYANKIFLGYTAEITGSVTDLGVTGDVGYYGENYNGKENIYAIDTITVNGEVDGAFDPYTSNVIAAKLTNTGNAFDSNQKVIVTVLKLASENQYTNKKTETYDEVMISESLVQTAGTGAVDGTIIKDLLITFNDDEDIDITLAVEFSDDQKAAIVNGDIYTIVFATGDASKGPDEEDNVSLTRSFEFDYESKTEGLISDVTFAYRDSFSAISGTRVYTNRADWNGCFAHFGLTFKLAQYADGSFNRITRIESRMVLVADADIEDYTVMQSKDMPLTPVTPFNVVNDGDYSYQLMNGFSNDTDKLPVDEPVNMNQVISLAADFATGYQSVEIKGSIPRIPWREWVAANRPIIFFDPAEENNNLNERTSNYAGVDGYSVFHEAYLEVEYTVLVPISSAGGVVKLKPQTTMTPYHLRSDAFEVFDYDVDGNPSIAISGDINIYDTDGIEVPDFSSTKIRLIEIPLPHDMGTLNINDLWAEIWIETANGTGEVLGQLHSSKDWSNSSNPLSGSQEVSPTNTAYVEIVSNLNEVVLYCITNPINLIPGVSYNAYGKLGKKTV